MKISRISTLVGGLLFAASSLLFSACSGGGSSGAGSGSGGGGGGTTGTLSLNATDAPFEFDIVQSASISVDKITIFVDSDSDSGPLVLYEGVPILMDLLALHDGVTQNIDQSTLPVGSYRQLRLRVTDAELTLTNGNHYTTDDGTIHLTSQGTSGFKVFIDPPIVVQGGQTTSALLDFDMTHTFHPIPANDALTANHYNLQPVIHVSNQGQSGGIMGTVSESDGHGGLVPVEAATIYVLPPGQTDTTLAVATTGTTATGTYTIDGLIPGPYDVQAVKGAKSALATGITTIAGEFTVVDLTINDGTGAVFGVVSKSDGLGGTITVDAANVYVLPPGVTDPLQAVGTGVTGLNGAYSITGIAPGTYDVLGVKGTLVGHAAGITVAAGADTQANLTLTETTGGVSGVVSQDNGSGGTIPVAAANVYVLHPGVTDPLQAVATTVTAVDGSYSLSGIAPGNYDLLAVKAALTGTVPGIAIVAGASTPVNVTIH
jgi:hypothetical protein